MTAIYRFGFRSKHLTVILLAVIVLMLGAVAYDAYKAVTGGFGSKIFAMWLGSSSYSEVRPGMTKKRITSLLGKPHKSGLNPWFESWYYNLPPNPQGSGNTYVVDGSEWNYVSLHFDPLGRVTRVLGEPVHHVLWPNGGPKPGMTKQEVRKLAGKPDDVMDNSKVYYELWGYQLWNGTTFVISLDDKGKVIRTGLVGSSVSIKD